MKKLLTAMLLMASIGVNAETTTEKQYKIIYTLMWAESCQELIVEKPFTKYMFIINQRAKELLSKSLSSTDSSIDKISSEIHDILKRKDIESIRNNCEYAYKLAMEL